jgi:Domain of unknown function (DUF4440)
MRVVAAMVVGAALLLSACSVPVWRETPVHSWAGATGGEHLERLFWSEIKASHWSELQRHLSSTFVAVTPNGRFDRTQALEYFKTLPAADYALSDCEVQPNGTDATVSCTLSTTGAGKSSSPSVMRTMTVWQQSRHGWVAIAHSAVPLGAR